MDDYEEELFVGFKTIIIIIIFQLSLLSPNKVSSLLLNSPSKLGFIFNPFNHFLYAFLNFLKVRGNSAYPQISKQFKKKVNTELFS